MGVNDNPVSFLSQVSKLVQQANSKVYNVMGRIAGDAAGAKKSGIYKVHNAIDRTVGDADGAKKSGSAPSLDSVVQDAAGGAGDNEKADLNATIEDPGREYENDPKIFHRPTKTLLMLSCKVPNAFIYANHKAGNLVGFVKVVSNSMGPSEPPAWKKLGKVYDDGVDKKSPHTAFADVTLSPQKTQQQKPPTLTHNQPQPQHFQMYRQQHRCQLPLLRHLWPLQLHQPLSHVQIFRSLQSHAV